MVVRLILAIVAFALAMAVLQMALVGLVLAGLIFRPKETIGLLLICGTISLFAAHPYICLGLLAAGGLVALAKSKGTDEGDEPKHLE
ncbi:hypothetical protein [Sphingomonas jatrophae]|uniref:Uncharacterized protein n=1 Tax=Sphingomonas jatrophae TaxID=1166337 RepID=A0A1I6K0H6_9SPHN|nr:hypothetical protein [Sphingomonas jatrophae]SFR84765.1 hypothetical protein SAMN05192580_1175 [Sphingomonas jatrophae]